MLLSNEIGMQDPWDPELYFYPEAPESYIDDQIWIMTSPIEINKKSPWPWIMRFGGLWISIGNPGYLRHVNLNPGSWIQDPESWIKDPGSRVLDPGSRILDW